MNKTWVARNEKVVWSTTGRAACSDDERRLKMVRRAEDTSCEECRVPTQQFRIFTLPELLPEGHVFVLNTHPYSLFTFVLTQLSAEVHGLVAQEVLTELEMYVLLALLEAYPEYCPYEVLRAAITDEVLSHARTTVHRAVEHKTLDRSMKPIRNILSRCRAKLRPFNINVRSIHAEGYMLTAMRCSH
jgi:hypothetical protein